MRFDKLDDKPIHSLTDQQIRKQMADRRKDEVRQDQIEDEKGHLHIPYLEYFADNLNREIIRRNKKNGSPIKYAVGRRDKITNMIQVLLQKDKNNPLLIGEAGVGKTDIVEGLADALNRDQVPDLLKGYQIYRLNLGLMNNNMNGQAGYFDSNLTHVIQECERYNDKIILFIDEIHMLFGAGKTLQGESMGSQLLKQPLGRGTIKLIGATTYDEYFKFISDDRAMQRRMEAVKVPEPTKPVVFKILKENMAGYTKHFQGITVSDDVLKQIINLAHRYMVDYFEPDKSFDLLNSSFSEAVIKHDDHITLRDVAEAIYQEENIPLSNVLKSLQPQVANLGKELGKDVKGQSDAIKTVVNGIDTFFAGLDDLGKPNASFLFLGTTGVGKTELAKAIAQALFGDKSNMIRLDMASFDTPDAVTKLIGKQGKRGILTEAVRRKPYSVLLLDEIEKSDKRVWNLLLSILDDGEIQDSRGRTVDFSNLIIIMTSNLAAKAISNRKAYDVPTNSPEEKLYEKKLFGEEVDSALRRTFKPELVNRLSNRVIFNILEKPQIIRISRKYIDDLIRKLRLQGYDLMFDFNVIDYLTDIGTDVINGARPLERAVYHHLKGPIANQIIAMQANKQEWLNKWQYYKTFVVSVGGDRPTKTDLWGSRHFIIKPRKEPVSSEEAKKRTNVFSSKSIATMMALHQDPSKIHAGLVNEINDRIKHNENQRQKLGI